MKPLCIQVEQLYSTLRLRKGIDARPFKILFIFCGKVFQSIQCRGDVSHRFAAICSKPDDDGGAFSRNVIMSNIWQG